MWYKILIFIWIEILFFFKSLALFLEKLYKVSKVDVAFKFLMLTSFTDFNKFSNLSYLYTQMQMNKNPRNN